jgi:hypothetical protein
MCREEGERRVGEERDTVEYCLVFCYAISHSFEQPQYKTSQANVATPDSSALAFLLSLPSFTRRFFFRQRLFTFGADILQGRPGI